MSLVLPLVVREAARQQLGLLTRRGLLARGMTDREVAAAVRSGELRRVRPGAYVTAADWAEVEATHRLPGLHALAVSQAVGGGSMPLAAATAAWVWALPRPARRRDDVERVHLLHPGGPGARGRDWVLRRAAIEADEITTRGAYRLTSVARTVVDVARTWREVDAVAAVDAALLRGLTTTAELVETLGRHTSVAGTPAVARVLALADGRSESWLETCGRLAFAAGSLPPFVPQVEIRLDGELLKVVDGWYPEAALAVEFDGRSKYRGPGASARDVWEEKKVEDLLRSFGIRFVRITYEMLTRGWTTLRSRITRELAQGGPTARDFAEVPRVAGKVRGGVAVEDAWLWRALDGVGGAQGPAGVISARGGR